MRHKWLLIVVLLLTGTLFPFSGLQLLMAQEEYASGENAYTDLEQYVVVPLPGPTIPTEPINSTESGENDTTESTASSEPTSIAYPSVDFEALREINADIVAWLYIGDTDINYPVVQGQDNSYYLKHLFTKEYNSSGCLFLDCKNSTTFLDQNSIIYGHHMRSGVMFASLDNYKNPEFAQSHPTFWLITPEQVYEVTVFSGYVSSIYTDAWNIGFSEAEFTEWLESAKRQSLFQNDVVPSSHDHILTLSTCSYEFSNARFVVLGLLRAVG